MIELGGLSLLLALMVGCYSTLACISAAFLRINNLASSGRYSLYTIPILLLVSSATLVNAFVTNDFSVKYVAENSSLSMPHSYTWVAMYAGNAGSLLFLTLVLSIVSAIAVAVTFRSLPHTGTFAAGILALTLTFFLFIIVGFANPMEKLDVVPLDGQGINPLLVHFGMFIHPPVQMSGLVMVAVPFAISMGSVMSGRGMSDDWVDHGRLWGMISWLILTLGLLLGSWWAYTILGWGGYWAWDPVENSALMPWLAMTAFVHSIMVQKRRGMFRKWNIVLIICAFAMAQMGMFINRGGPVPSVHSFAQSSMGWLFLFFMGFSLIASIIILFFKADTLKSKSHLESFLSREGVLFIQNVLFLAVALITLWGTIFPIFSEAAQGETVTVGAPYFNLINGPILLLLVALMGVGPLLPWRTTTIGKMLKTIRIPVLVAIAVFAILLSLGIGQGIAIFAFSICGMVVASIFQEWIRGTISRTKNGEMPVVAFANLLTNNRVRYGGYVVHLSIIMLSVGVIGSSFYAVQRDLVLTPGETGEIGRYTFKYLGVDKTLFKDRVEEVAEIETYVDGEYSLNMRPYRAFYPEFRIAATRGAIRSTLVEDFYIVPSAFEDNGQAVFRILINPLVWWMWASGPLLIAGFLLGMWPQRQLAASTVIMRSLKQATRA